jgi:hypothetical protein
MTSKYSEYIINRTPSIDFYSEAYEVYLKYAQPYELENDIVTKVTLQKITKELELN